MSIERYLYRKTVVDVGLDYDGDEIYEPRFIVYKISVLGQHYLTDNEGYTYPQYTCSVHRVASFKTIEECEAYIHGAKETGYVDLGDSYSCSVSSMGNPGKYPLNSSVSVEPLFEIAEAEIINVGKY